MGVGEGCIYYNSKQGFNLKEAISFFEKVGFALKHPETQEIITVDCEGESYAISYEELVDNFSNNNLSSNNRLVVKLWQDEYYYLYCDFTEFDNIFVFETSFHSFYSDEQIEKAAKFFIDFFFEQLPKNKTIIGMYVDRFARTEDVVYWNDFFTKPDIIATILPNIIFLEKDKLINIKANTYSYTSKAIDDYILMVEQPS